MLAVSKKSALVSIAFICAAVCDAANDERSALEERVLRVELELAEARASLAEFDAEGTGQIEEETNSDTEETDDLGSGIGLSVGTAGKLRIGGAVRVNYVLGDYPGGGVGPSRGGHGGDVELDTFRFNVVYEYESWSAKAEYRFYNGYNFFHTASIGKRLGETDRLELGLTRVPFGAGPYGVSQSWFFDQHYYVGLADDMDLGIKYRRESGDWQWDFAYFVRSEWNGRGTTNQSARYSYDVVDESGSGFEERNQVNVRGIRSWSGEGGLSGAVGLSLEFGELASNGLGDDGEHWAASIHAVTNVGAWTLGTQLSYYEYKGAGDVVVMGAYDFPVEVAAEGFVPALSLSYLWDTDNISWLDSIRPYFEYSSVLKTEEDFNDSNLLTLGAAFARGPWYVYLDWVFSDGNEFIGGEVPYGDRLAANPENEWQQRLNINFGLYY